LVILKDEVARRVDEVEDQHRQPDQQEVAIGEHQREPAPRVTLPGRAVGHAFPVAEARAVAHVRQQHAADQQPRGDQHQMMRMQPLDGARGDLRAQDPSDGAARRDDREQTLPFRFPGTNVARTAYPTPPALPGGYIHSLSPSVQC